jgi:hypothetical protein
MNKLNASGVDAGDKPQLNSVNDLYGTFIHFFSKGAPAERYMADEDTFQLLVKIATEHRDIKTMVFRRKKSIFSEPKILVPHRRQRGFVCSKNCFFFSSYYSNLKFFLKIEKICIF